MDELHTMDLAGPFGFTKGSKVLRLRGQPFMADAYSFGTLLFDLQADPQQHTPITDPVVEERMVSLMTGLMRENDAPGEQFERLGLSPSP